LSGSVSYVNEPNDADDSRSEPVELDDVPERELVHLMSMILFWLLKLDARWW
jgi:hypothetical protein